MTAKLLDRPVTDTDGKSLRRPGMLGPGDIIDHKFQVIEQLGEGGMGCVFRTEHLLLGKEMAVKVLHAFGSYDDISERRFRDEAQILAQVKHENIVKVADAGVAVKGELYLAMEFLHGETLSAWLSKFPPGERDAEFIDTLIYYLTSITDAVHALHENKIIHRDLKPENVILHRRTVDGRDIITPKVIDFGIAKKLDSVEKRTVEGSVLGTPEYIAPEVQAGAPPDEKSDVFALGVILYEGLTGRKPEVAGREDEVFTRSTDRKVVLISPSRFNPNVTRELDTVCKAALEPRPEMRLPTARELSKRLAELPSFVSRSKALKAEAPSKALPKSVILYLVAAAVAVCIFLFALGIWIFALPFGKFFSAQNETPANIPGEKQENSNAARAAALPLEPRPSDLSNAEGATGEKPAGPKASDTPHSRASSRASAKASAKSRPQKSPADSARTANPNALLLKEGKAAFYAMKYAEAAHKLAQVASADSGKKGAAAVFYLSRIHYQQGRTALAIKEIREAINRHGDPEKRIYLGMFLATQGDKSAAVSQWKKVYCGQNVPRRLKEKTRRLLENNSVALDDLCGD